MTVASGGDTALTKVFVGGLAWETPMEAMRRHFEAFGEIVEAVIISDKLTGRSKGYGFVTFKEAEAAKKACEDATPIINGRRANCNLAALGARRPPRSASATPPPPHQPPIAATNANAFKPTTAPAAPTPANHVRWYYPANTTPFHAPHHNHQSIPFFGYTPTYIAADVAFNQKVNYNGGTYINGQYAQMYPVQAMSTMMGAHTMMPMYPIYYHQQSHQAAMGLPAHMFSPSSAGPIVPPPIISKPISVSVAQPTTGTVGEKES